MKKVMLNIKIENNEESIKTNIIGKKNNNTIFYNDNGIETQLKMLKKSIKITRKKREYSIELNFKEKSKTICTYLIYKDNIKIELDVYTSIIEKRDNIVKIEYELYNEKEKLGDYKYKISFREE